MQKKWVIGITAVTLAAATAIGSTLAYFTTKTDPMTNNFTVATGNDKGITGQLREKNWDGYDFNEFVDKVSKNPDGSALKGDLTEADPDHPTYGVDMAKIMLPGDVIPKNPTLKNTTNWDFVNNQVIAGKVDVPVYMAMKVTYNNFNNVKINSDNKINAGWVDIATTPSDPAGTCTKIYVWYGLDANKATNKAPMAVSSGKPTDPLFNTVTVNRDATHNDGTESTVLKSFDIELQGAAIQARNLPNDTADHISVINDQLTGLLK